MEKVEQEKLKENKELINERIQKLLSIDDFVLSPVYLQAIHKYLFTGILYDPGTYREDNLRKSERILNLDSVNYTDYHAIEFYLKYDFYEENKYDYKSLSAERIVDNITDFSRRIWQVHPFEEGNTRTVSIFIEKYLRHLGFYVDNRLFKEESVYFRGALVKATYVNYEKHIMPDKKPLKIFFRNLILHTECELDKSTLFVKELFEEEPIKPKKKIIRK